MKRSFLILPAVAGLFALIAPSQLHAQGEEPNGAVETLTRGPVHEAFAEPVAAEQGQKTIIVPKAPPQPIEELPPEEKPAGENVQWMSGYWAWDDDMKDFLWVSGIWRQLPPSRQWVAGYWNDIGTGFQWTPGFWTSAQAEAITYLPEPPQPVAEAVPPQVNADQFWVPGVYMYADGRYRWRGGYWHRIDPEWIWTPAHYMATPGGYVYVEGYWDYPVAQRGVIFAPVYYREPIYRQAHYVYSPTVAIDVNLFTVHLFARPRYCHYYFGDYYAASYADVGIYPWFAVKSYTTVGYDPLFSYYRWDYSRHDSNWSISIGERFHYLQSHEEFRPPHTVVQQNTFVRNNTTIINNTTINNINNNTINKAAFARSNVLTAPVSQIAKSADSPMQFEKLDHRDRTALAQNAVTHQEFAQQRAKVEAGSSNTSFKGPVSNNKEFQPAAPLKLVKTEQPKLNSQLIDSPAGKHSDRGQNSGPNLSGTGGNDPGKSGERFPRGNNSITNNPPVSPDASKSGKTDRTFSSGAGNNNPSAGPNAGFKPSPTASLKDPNDAAKTLTPPSLGKNTPTDNGNNPRDPRDFGKRGGADASNQPPSLLPGTSKTPSGSGNPANTFAPGGNTNGNNNNKTFKADNTPKVDAGPKSGFNPITGAPNTDNAPRFTPKTDAPVSNQPKFDNTPRNTPKIDNTPKVDLSPKSQPKVDAPKIDNTPKFVAPQPKIDNTPKQLPKIDNTPRQPPKSDKQPGKGDQPKQTQFDSAPRSNAIVNQPKIDITPKFVAPTQAKIDAVPKFAVPQPRVAPPQPKVDNTPKVVAPTQPKIDTTPKFVAPTQKAISPQPAGRVTPMPTPPTPAALPSAVKPAGKDKDRDNRP